ncbi:AAA family ATPase [[Phormidium] sp. ETS-05]|uniref:AAA family ATPase n=1 Tax=[Phormidium] sp. ETS-05 TaxID=222819 RepID=UPI0018EF01AB|nr:AAA family ATPase [[Phormidium] sp. ETS-05]
MKIQSIQLKYFKRFRELNLDFTDYQTGLAKNLILLIGINGAGKTSILQAIAAALGRATGRLKSPADLTWPGFNYELLASSWGRFNSQVNLQLQFSTSELNNIAELHQKLTDMGHDLPVAPGASHLVQLHWVGERVDADNAAELFQFKGRQYAKQLVRSEGFQVFERVGTVLWYTEQRTATSLTTEDPDKQLEITEDILRDRLFKWQHFHQDVATGKIKQLRPGQKDVYAEIERIYKQLFPRRSFEGSIPRENIDDILSEPWFYLYDGNKQYEISEMSGGERAIFPMIVDFVNWNIHNSVILIDELELHLHPPMQQALLRVLPKLGKNNQFIITTHSDAVAALVPNAHIIRVEEKVEERVAAEV